MKPDPDQQTPTPPDFTVEVLEAWRDSHKSTPGSLSGTVFTFGVCRFVFLPWVGD